MEVYFTSSNINVPILDGEGNLQSYENNIELHLKVKIRKCVSGEILNKQF